MFGGIDRSSGRWATKSGRHAFALVLCVLLLAIIPVIGLAANATVGFSGRVAASSDGAHFGPLRGYANTFTNQAAITLSVANPSGQPVRIQLSAFDARFNRLNDVALPAMDRIAARSSRQITAFVPLHNVKKRKLRICARFNQQPPICGRYIVRQM